MIRRTTRLCALAGMFCIALSAPLWATPISYDELLYEDGDNPAVLDASIDMSVSGNTLTIVLTNTSTADAGSTGAGNLLAGLGFNLPSGVTINSGDVSMIGSIAINFTAPGDNDVSSEWGYNNGIPGSGHFDADGPATLSVNTVVSSQANDGPNQFAPGSLGPPPTLGGPDFGAASPNAPVGGQEGINDHVTITLLLDGVVPATLIADIDAASVVVAFGSPTNSTIPEPSAGFLLMSALAVTAMARRRRTAN